MIKILKTNLKNIKDIIHVGDIHCRLNSRIFEYREVFSNFFNDIKHLPKDETIIVNTGDTCHNKNDMQPEGIQLVKELFMGCANLFPTIIIPGNHDGLIQNKNRLDSITPIIEMLNNPNLYYLKESGLYGFGNILFNHMSIFNELDKYILGKDIPAIYRNQYKHIIALFHGPVDGSVTDTGHRIENPDIMLPLFDNHHLVLCGDIHRLQVLQEYDSDNNKPCVKFCGSLCQQNHGESLENHGYSLWDLSDYSNVHHEVKNDYGYFTIEVNKGKLITSLTDIPKKVRLRVKCYDSIATEVKAIVSKIKEAAEIIEISHVRMEPEQDKSDVISLCKDIVLTDLTNVDYQNRLIVEFLKEKLKIIDQAKIDNILRINRDTNPLIKRDDFTRNLKWRPIELQWSNMFTYGENNSINFEHMSGIYGIFGKNASGKSSIFDVLLFTLFDKTSRVYKGAHVLNSQKTSFKCKLEFEISEIRYFIERTGSTSRSGNVKVDVKFWKKVGDVEEELHGTARRDTNDIIRDYVGTYEDFVATAASFQQAKDYKPFIDMGNSDRKDLMVQFMGLNVFDRLHESANERNKELNTILKIHKDKNYSSDIQQNQSALDYAVSLFDDKSKEIDILKKQIADVNEQIIAETANLIRLDDDVPTDFKGLETKKTAIETSVRQRQQSLNGFRTILAEREKTIADISVQIKKIESSNLVDSHKTYKNLTDRINDVKQKMDLKKIEIKGKLDKVARLNKHKYDPNCKFCIDNDFVRDATKAKTELTEDKKEADKFLITLDDLRTEIAKFQWVEQVYETYTKLLTERGKFKDEYGVLSRNIIVTTNDLEKVNQSFADVTRQIELYHRNAISVEANEKVKAKIATYRNALTRLDLNFQHHHRLLMEISGKQELFKNQIATLTKTMNDVIAMENESDSYQHYLTAIGRDGISYQVICNTCPEIEREVNSILSQVVDFTIQFETDGKNIIPYVVYSDKGKWPIELVSGYERFITSIAIRVALTEISSLSRCNFMAVDEGMGTLDSDNISIMPTFFSILKNYYDFVIVVSHLDSIKDAVDKQIEITYNGTLAKVNY